MQPNKDLTFQERWLGYVEKGRGQYNHLCRKFIADKLRSTLGQQSQVIKFFQIKTWNFNPAGLDYDYFHKLGTKTLLLSKFIERALRALR